MALTGPDEFVGGEPGPAVSAVYDRAEIKYLNSRAVKDRAYSYNVRSF